MNMSATFDLFQGMVQGQIRREELCPGAVLLRGFAAENERLFLPELPGVTAQAPFSPHGHTRWFSYVDRNNELRSLWLGDQSYGLSL